MQYDHVVFRAAGPSSESRAALPAGYAFELWTPSLLPTTPASVPERTYRVWWLFHRLHVFRNREYSVAIVWHGDEVAHRLALFPGYFRFPFMQRDDLQIGDVWTDPAHRGRGLAAAGLQFAMRHTKRSDRAFWYLTEETNTASIRTAERAGLRRYGTATRTSRLGVRLFGQFIVHPDPGAV